MNNARYYWLLLAEGHLIRRRFGAMRGRTALLCGRVVEAGQVHIGIGRLDSRKSLQVWYLPAMLRIVLEKSPLPANLCPLSGCAEFARFRDDLGEPVGKSVEATA